MKISLIVATDQNRLISHHQTIPWYLPNDLAYFKTLTMGKPVIMGHKTYCSIGKPLVNRRNIVLSRNASLVIPGCEVYLDYRKALQAIPDTSEVMIIGGRDIYQLFLPMATIIYLTLVHASFSFSKANRYFPNLEPEVWQTIKRIDNPIDSKHLYAYSFITLQRS